jgi:cytochrome c
MMRARARSGGRNNIALAGALGLFAVQVPAEASDIAYGEYLSNECVTCHQRTGNYSGIPSITGWPQETFVQALNAYRWRERSNPIMQTIADQLSDEDMAALAAYFESLGPPKITTDQPVSRGE